MATQFNIDQLVFNGVDYDKLNPTTTIDNVVGTVPIDRGGTGAITASGGLSNLGGTSQTYVDNTFLQKNNGTLTGQLNINNQRMINVPLPVASGDAVNQGYVDNSIRISKQTDTFSLYMMGGFWK